MHARLKILSIALILVGAGPARAETEAEGAYQAGKAAFGAEEFAKARDLFAKASATDARNPDVWLWLGKANYQLGEVHQAIAAWQKTLQLAPREPFAGRMVKALRGEVTEPAALLSLTEGLVGGGLHAAALKHCDRLLAHEALSDAQRAKALTLRGEALLATKPSADAEIALHEVLTRFPDSAEAETARYLLASARLKRGGPQAAEALATLKQIVTPKASEAVAASAAYELIRFDLAQGATGARVQALSQWVAANTTHRNSEDALRLLVLHNLELSGLSGTPGPGAALNEFDLAALKTAAELYPRIASEKEAQQLTQQILKHVSSRYAARKAHDASLAAVDSLLKAPLPRTSRLETLQALASYRTSQALEDLTKQAEQGKLAGQLPKSLQDLLAVTATINAEFPNPGAWPARVGLAQRVQALASSLPWPAERTALQVPYTWAAEILVPVVKSAPLDKSRSEAANAMMGLVRAAAKDFQELADRDIALALNAQLVAALPDPAPQRKDALVQRVELLSDFVIAEFNENAKVGEREKSAALTDRQKELIAVLGELADKRGLKASEAIDKLAPQLQLLTAHGHYGAAEAACNLLSQSLPELERRQAQLRIVRLWVQQVTREHQRLRAAGLSVPRELDPQLLKALRRCFELQVGVDEGDSFAKSVRTAWGEIISHYTQLRFHGVAEQAAGAVPENPVDAPHAHAYAALAQANLKADEAQRELARALKAHKGRQELKLTDAFKAALAAYRKFIQDRPTHSLAASAVDRTFRIAGTFEQHAAFDVAVAVYRDFATFAAGQKTLSQESPGKASVSERAAFAVGLALQAKAGQALKKWLAEKKPEAPAPAQLSDEFVAARQSHKAFIAANPRSVLLPAALGKIMEIALVYANAGSWDVAAGVYADLLGSGLPLQRPDRLEFLQGVCQLGKAMPAHALNVISTLTRPGVSGGEGAEELAALNAPAGAGGAGRPGPASGAINARGTLRTNAGDEVTARQSLTLGLQTNGGQVQVQMDNDDVVLLAAVRQQEQQRSARIAGLRDQLAVNANISINGQMEQQGEQVQQAAQFRIAPSVVLSEAELARQAGAITAAYTIFQAVRTKYPQNVTAIQARGQMMALIDHWRQLTEWQRAAELARQFLKDNPDDSGLPQIRLAVARDYLALASKPVPGEPTRQERLAEVARRFTEARAELTKLAEDRDIEKSVRQIAQWDLANSFLTQARVVNAFSKTLARGQFVRAARELLSLAKTYYDHPNMAQVPQMLSSIAQELASRAYHDEAIIVWNELIIHDPSNPLSAASAMMIAETYQSKLQRPLRAAEVYFEINFARGGDQSIQNLIYQIGAGLKNQKRWVEALHVLGTFVAGFPRHARAGEALAAVGQIHQANEAWDDAIAAYQRVINEFGPGDWVRQARWSIAECQINLSQWPTAMHSCRAYKAAYAEDARAAQADLRVGILKDLARYQALVNEKGQRKAFDAQFQIARIVKTQLSNSVKSIIEYRKVATNWPESHLADDALFQVGTTYLAMDEVAKAREALLQLARQYNNSPLADDALLLVGQSYEDESRKLAQVTRSGTWAKNEALVQGTAYQRQKQLQFDNRLANTGRVIKLKKAGKGQMAQAEMARNAAQSFQFDAANVMLLVQEAQQKIQVLTAAQLAAQQDKINAALRKALPAYREAAQVPAADKAGDALLRMASIYDKQLKDAPKAMAVWEEIVRQFSGTSVAEDASWRIAAYYEQHRKYAEAIEAYKAFLRNYRRSPKAGAAQFSVAENYEHLDQWVEAMDAYTNYIKNFADGPMVKKAQEQINWIKTYRL